MHTRSRRIAAAAAVLALLTAACGDDDEAGEDAGTEEPADTGDEGAEEGGAAISFTAIDYGYSEAPEEITAGALEITLVNEGEVGHEVAFATLDGTSTEQFAEDLAVTLEGGPFPEYAEVVAGSPEVDAGDELTFGLTLPAGDYAFFCTFNGDAENPESEEGGDPHFQRGMLQEITVAEGDDDAALPEGDGAITAVDYDFEPDVEAGDSAIVFRNDGPDQVHFAGLSVFPEGTTADDAEAAFATLLELPEDEEPPAGTVFPEDVADSGVISAGLETTMEIPGGFESGRTYLLVCFIQDRAGGPPHAIGNQMFTAFTVE